MNHHYEISRLESKPDFRKALSLFKENFTFKKHLRSLECDFSPDTIAHEIVTNRGNALLIEIDRIDKIDYLKSLGEAIGKYNKFVPVKQILEFKQSLPVKLASVYQQPEDWGELKKFAAEGAASEPYFFLFLLAKGKK